MSTLEQKQLASVIYESVETLGPKIGPMIRAALPQDEYTRYNNIVKLVLSKDQLNTSVDKINELWEDFVKACAREGLL
jgi:hypothetical protein